MNKSGVSAVVATVLIVMITVAAVGLLWAVVYPLLSANIKDKTDCVEAEMSVSIDIDSRYTCNSENNGTAVKVARGADEKDWIGVQIIYTDSKGESERITYLEYPKPNSEKVYRNVNATDVVAISVTPALRKNDREFLYCSKSVEVAQVRNCTAEVEDSLTGTDVNEDDLREQGADINNILGIIQDGEDLGDIIDLLEYGVPVDDLEGEESDDESGVDLGEGDCISDDVCIMRGIMGPPYNSLVQEVDDVMWSRSSGPTGTEWAAGTCGALVTPFLSFGGARWHTNGPRSGESYSGLAGENFCLYIPSTGKYYDVEILEWGQYGEGDFAYNRIDNSTSETVEFVRPMEPLGDNCFTDNVCLARGSYGPIYNSVTETYSRYYSAPYSPKGTEWAYGSCENNQTSFGSFYYNVCRYSGYGCGNNVPGSQTCVHLTEEDLYYEVNWTSWNKGSWSGGPGDGGFAFTKKLNRNMGALA
jgi:hypothetical protein